MYWFRTPPGVRIGRSALDEDAIRLIEAHNPDVEFDWTRILKGQDAPVEARPAAQPDRRGKQRREFAPRPPAARGPTPAQAPPEPPAAPTATEFVAPDDTPVEVPIEVEPPAREEAPVEVALSNVAELPEMALLEELLADPAADGATDRMPPAEAVSAAQARLGSEGLSRLRARHSEVLARISETIVDPARRDELKSQADRLNPDTWVTEAEVTAGLEEYESTFESLRTVVGRRRQRRRRSGQARDASPAGAGDTSPEPPAGGEEADVQETGEDL